MDAKQLLILVFQVAIVATVFGYGLKSTKEDLLYVVQRPGLLVRSLLSMLVVMPVLAVLFVRAFDLRQTTQVVLIALSISPVPPLLLQRESKAGGRRPYGLGLMLVLGVVSIVAIPLVIAILERLFSRSFTADTGAIVRIVLIAVLLPLLAGVVIRMVMPRIAERLDKPVRILANGLLLVGVIVLLIAGWQVIWAAVGGGTILAMIAFVVAGLLVGHLLGGPQREHAVVLAMATACRHPAIALAIASSNFPDERFGGTIILYLLVSIVVCVPYIAWQRRLMAASSASVA